MKLEYKGFGDNKIAETIKELADELKREMKNYYGIRIDHKNGQTPLDFNYTSSVMKKLYI